MARIVVEDCLENVANKYELVALGALRARELLEGEKSIILGEKNDKTTVIALKEFAKGRLDEDDEEEISRRQHLVARLRHAYSESFKRRDIESEAEEEELSIDSNNYVLDSMEMEGMEDSFPYFGDDVADYADLEEDLEAK
jgi:DNA-directed RNA polymerase subunit omega